MYKQSTMGKAPTVTVSPHQTTGSTVFIFFCINVLALWNFMEVQLHSPEQRHGWSSMEIYFKDV